jgi:Spy/CpxP family protein refolding chaperone
MRTVGVFAILTLALGALAADFMDLPPGRWWKNSDVIRELNLTPDQQKKLDDIMFIQMDKMIDLRAALDKEELKLKMLLDAPQIVEKQVLDQVDRVLAARDRMHRLRAEMFVKVRTLLTPDQWERMKAKFKDAVRERFLRRMQGGHPDAGEERPPQPSEKGQGPGAL